MKQKRLIELPKLRQDVIKSVYTKYSKFNDLIDTILDRKRKEQNDKGKDKRKG
jgi:hypothetical protein